jgi:glycosyltransferase involved in cell wall biosynthesis
MLYYKKSKPQYGLNGDTQRTPKVIVSLTSYPASLPYLHICIKSLLNQTYKPDKIILYLGEDTKKEDVTAQVWELCPFGLEIVFCPDNLMTHKKYIYAMQQYPEDIIITVDDDAIYSRKLIGSLVRSYAQHPNAVSGRVVSKIISDEGQCLPYGNWRRQYAFVWRKKRRPSRQLMAVGVGGILYPPASKKLMAEEVFDIDLIINVCDRFNDDIWLKTHQLRAGTPVAVTPGIMSFAVLPHTRETALFTLQVDGMPHQDYYMDRLRRHFDMDFADYVKRQDVE